MQITKLHSRNSIWNTLQTCNQLLNKWKLVWRWLRVIACTTNFRELSVTTIYHSAWWQKLFSLSSWHTANCWLITDLFTSSDHVFPTFHCSTFSQSFVHWKGTAHRGISITVSGQKKWKYFRFRFAHASSVSLQFPNASASGTRPEGHNCYLHYSPIELLSKCVSFRGDSSFDLMTLSSDDNSRPYHGR